MRLDAYTLQRIYFPRGLEGSTSSRSRVMARKAFNKGIRKCNRSYGCAQNRWSRIGAPICRSRFRFKTQEDEGIKSAEWKHKIALSL